MTRKPIDGPLPAFIDRKICGVPIAGIRRKIKEYAEHLRNCASDALPDEVHELRVSMRRLDVAISIVASERQPKPLRVISKSLHRSLSKTSKLRDVQVLMEQMHARLADAPASRTVYDALQREEQRLKKKLTRAFADSTFPDERALSVLQDLTVMAAPAAMVLETAYMRLQKRLAPIAKGDNRGIHHARDMVRILRYVLEMLRDETEPAIREQLQLLREMQTSFGTAHDLVIFREYLLRPESLNEADSDIRRTLAQSVAKELRPLFKQSVKLAEQGLSLRPVAVGSAHDGPVHARIYLMRHAIAKDRETYLLDDRTRPLTKKGRKKMEKIAQGIASLNLAPDVILTSTFVRAFDTARILATILPGDIPVRRCPWLIPSSPVDTAVASLAPFIRDGKSVVVVGHEPMLQQLTMRLAAKTGEPLRKGGLCKIAFATGDVRRKGSVSWTLTPKQLLL